MRLESCLVLTEEGNQINFSEIKNKKFILKKTKTCDNCIPWNSVVNDSDESKDLRKKLPFSTMNDYGSRSDLAKGKCPNEKCGNICYFEVRQNKDVVCKKCNQIHCENNLLEKETNLSVEDMEAAILSLSNSQRQWGDVEAVKVNDLSNYQCKLISSLMTTYGVDRETRQARLLSSMSAGCCNSKGTFDCSKLGGKAFVIDAKHLDIIGYGIDPSASSYLSSVLDMTKEYNGCERYPLVPIHADGDGHCLVHAISRCLVGQQLFWHPLMTNLKQELEMNLEKYKMQFCDFIEENDWRSIVEEADPSYEPIEGEPSGLRNIHVFALANVLHRPIMLLDSLEGLQSAADYSGLFLPVFVPPEKCREKDGTFNKPLAISWSSKGRNHFVALVAVKRDGEGSTYRLPPILMPTVWGGFQDFISRYIDLGEDQSCIIAGSNSLKDSYIHQLVSCMERQFMILHGVSASAVADYYHAIIRKSGGKFNIQYSKMIETARRSMEEETLHKCISCGWMTDYSYGDEQRDMLLPGGMLFQIAKVAHKVLQDGTKYRFPLHNVTCRYDAKKNRLIFHIVETCERCSNDMRVVMPDGSIKYRNGDAVEKHENKIFWERELYDCLPESFEVDMSWKDSIGLTENVFWFYKEKESWRNSNAFQIAEKLVQKHYPLEFDNSKLIQRVVNEIMQKTAHLKQVYPEPERLPERSGQSSNYFQNKQGETRNDATKEPTNGFSTAEFKDAKATIKKKAQQKIQRKENSISPSKANSKTMTNKTTEACVTPEKDEAVKQPNATESSTNTIRVSANGKSLTMEIPVDMTYSQLQARLEEQVGIPRQCQRIKIGFPPKPIQPTTTTTADGDEATLSLKHGDRILVERVAKQGGSAHDGNASIRTRPKQQQRAKEVSNAKNNNNNSNSSTADGKEPVKDHQRSSTPHNLSLDLLDALGNGGKLDLWDYFADKPEFFKRKGVVFKLIEKDYGILKDGEHLCLSYFPNKVLCYTESTDEMQLCLGERHIPVQPLSKEDHTAAAEQMAKYTSHPSGPRCHVLQGGGNQGKLGSIFQSETATATTDAGKTAMTVPFSGVGQRLEVFEQNNMQRSTEKIPIDELDQSEDSIVDNQGELQDTVQIHEDNAVDKQETDSDTGPDISANISTLVSDDFVDKDSKTSEET
eukprot:gene16649-18339_t